MSSIVRIGRGSHASALHPTKPIFRETIACFALYSHNNNSCFVIDCDILTSFCWTSSGNGARNYLVEIPCDYREKDKNTQLS